MMYGPENYDEDPAYDDPRISSIEWERDYDRDEEREWAGEEPYPDV